MLHKRPIKGVTILPVQDDLHSLDTIVHGADESLYKGAINKKHVIEMWGILEFIDCRRKI